MLVCQPLDPASSNIINTLPEAMQYVWEVDHPNFQGMLDAGPFLSSGEPLENLRDAMPWIRHVHVPGDRQDLSPILSELKRANYDELISVVLPDRQESNSQLLEFLKQQWSEA
jgi:sugar phosphate isomerase/epimerase